MAKPSFQEQVFRVREEAIVAAVNRQLAEKGFDMMTVDAVAAEVGIAKASLYKHFASKEDLASAAMAFVLERALTEATRLAADSGLDDFERLRAMARWAVHQQVSGDMPALPIQNPSLREAMVRSTTYMERLVRLSDLLGGWIQSAQASGQLDPGLPPELTLFTLFSKGCDPVVYVLKHAGQHTDEQIVDWVVTACFSGLSGRPLAQAGAARQSKSEGASGS
jgi:AcrR family transcriptional regulator